MVVLQIKKNKLLMNVLKMISLACFFLALFKGPMLMLIPVLWCPT